MLLIAACFLLLFPVNVQAAQKKPTWTVTQYGSSKDFGSQSMFYTLHNKNGNLIVIDGGWKSNENTVRSAIKRLGSKVDIWIITHPHPDHTGAFNAIFSSPKGIKIKKVYASGINAKVYKNKARPWDEYSVFQKFSRITAGKSNVTYLKAGTSFSFVGLKFQFFNTYNSSLNKLTNDICNDSSLVFKVTGSKKSMLFSGDINARIGNLLVKKYGNKLSSDYLQMPHHGNNLNREKFLKKVNPRMAFFDAPVWLQNYPAVKANKSYLRKIGCKIITYGAGRNTLKLS